MPFRKMRLLSAALCCLGAPAMVAPAARAQPAPPVPADGGIYMLVDPRVTQNGNRPMYALYEQALQDADVDGVTIIMPWANMYASAQPGPGNYDWAFLDTWTAAAIAHGKKLSIGVIAGMYSPAWLLAAPYSVPAHEFTFNSGPVSNADCVTRLLPTPWVPAFTHAYRQAMIDLAAHLRATGAYASVTMVKLGGLNEETEELGIGATRQADYNCPLSGTSQYLTSGWASAGFTPARIAQAWRAMSQAIAGSFPKAELSVDVLASQEAFPSVGPSSEVEAVPSGPTDATTAAIVSGTLLPGPGQRGFHGRFEVQWDALSTGSVDPEVLSAAQMGAQVGWQMNDGLGSKGANCAMANGAFGPCAGPAQFQAMLDNGIALGGRYVEVMATDVLQFPSAFVEPHRRLTGASN